MELKQELAGQRAETDREDRHADNREGGRRQGTAAPLLRHSRSLMPKQPAHSSRAMYLSLSRSQVSKKRVVQCSMGMRGARRGASSVWDRYLRGGGGRGLRPGRAADLLRAAEHRASVSPSIGREGVGHNV